jgi:hypothetical protein
VLLLLRLVQGLGAGALGLFAFLGRARMRAPSLQLVVLFVEAAHLLVTPLLVVRIAPRRAFLRRAGGNVSGHDQAPWKAIAFKLADAVLVDVGTARDSPSENTHVAAAAA